MKTVESLAKEFKEEAKSVNNDFIASLTRKIKLLETENEELKKRIQELTSAPSENSEDALAVCRAEIKKLRKTSEERELTLEEARKFDLYVKQMKLLDRKKEEKDELKEEDTETLLSEIYN